MSNTTTAPAGVVSSTELGGDMPGDEDGDLQTRYDMLKSWLVEADASNDRLRKHLHNVLEIADTWQPGYATKMDRDTLALAAQAIGYESPNAEVEAKPSNVNSEMLEALEHIMRCIPMGGFAQIHHGSSTWEQIDAAVAAERERCAKRCDALAKDCTGINERLAYRHAATEIRGQTQTLNQEKA